MLYIDGSAGVSGDRLLAAFVDAGMPVRWLARMLARGPLPPVRLTARRGPGGQGTVLERRWRGAARWRPQHPAPNGAPVRPSGQPAAAVLRAVAASDLPPPVKRTAGQVLRRLVWAEARAHRCAMRQVILRQVSRPDAMAAVIGVSAGLAWFRVRRVAVSPLLLGSRYQDHQGRWRRAVGPAVHHLTARWPVWVSRAPVECTTPTGAAIVMALARGPYRRSVRRRVLARPMPAQGRRLVVRQGIGWPWPAARGARPVKILVFA